MSNGTRIQRSSDPHMEGTARRPPADGFSLVEMLIAIFILAFGLMAVSQMIYVSVSSANLARTKGNVSVVAQDKLEFLSDLYARNPSAAELTNGAHGPEVVTVMNPTSNTALNRFNVSWTVITLADPRPGKVLIAKQVEVTVRPLNNSDVETYRAFSTKAAVVVGIFSPRT